MHSMMMSSWPWKTWDWTGSGPFRYLGRSGEQIKQAAFPLACLSCIVFFLSTWVFLLLSFPSSFVLPGLGRKEEAAVECADVIGECGHWYGISLGFSLFPLLFGSR